MREVILKVVFMSLYGVALDLDGMVGICLTLRGAFGFQGFIEI